MPSEVETILLCRSANVHNDMMLDWNDAQYFLAVAETGSTLAAGRLLRVSQTTVARRVIALEQSLDLTLFERRRAGYTLTAVGEALLPEARALRASAVQFSDAATAQRRLEGGTVRLTAEESYVINVLPPILRDLHEKHPDIVIELDATEDVRDLEAGAADIAIRVTNNIESAVGLVGRRIGIDFWSVYCSRAYAASHPLPGSRHELASHPLIGGGGGEIGRYYRTWLKENGLEGAIAMQHSTVVGLMSAVRSGMGLAALPCFVAEADEDFVRCLRPVASGGREIWLVTHERLREVPRVRVVMDFLGDRLRRHSMDVSGRLAAGFYT